MQGFARLWATSALALTLLSTAGLALAQEEPESPLAQIETLRREFDEMRGNVRELEARAREATGSAAAALRIKAAEERLETVESFGALVEGMLDLEGISIPFPQRDVHLIPTASDVGRQVTSSVASRMGSDRSPHSAQTESDAEA